MKKIVGALAASILTLGLFSCTNKDNSFKPKYDTDREYSVNVVGHYENFEARY